MSAEKLKYLVRERQSLSHNSIITRYLCTVLSIALTTIAAMMLVPRLGTGILTILYLLPVFISAIYWGLGPTLLASFLGVLTLDFFFVPPVYTLTVSDPKDFTALALFLLVGIVTGSMATKLRNESERTAKRERRTLALYRLSEEMASKSDLNDIARSFAETAAEVTAGRVTIFMPEKDGYGIRAIASFPPRSLTLNKKEQAVVQWVLGRGRPAGRGTDTLQDACELIIPAIADQEIVAALLIDPSAKTEMISPEQEQLVHALSNLAAVAIMRVTLAKEAERLQCLAESERLHQALLNSISHDLRTPLASVMGAVSGLLDEEGVYDATTTTTFLDIIKQGALRLNRFIGNLLDMARLESDTLRLKKDWHDMQDLIGVSLKETEAVLKEHVLRTDIASDLPLVEVDFGLIEHVLINLLENAAKYSARGTEIRILVQNAGTALLVTVADQGPSVPEGERAHVFEKFYRLQYARSMDGMGLGLTICKGIIEAHGGRIWLDGNPEGGNSVTFSLPQKRETEKREQTRNERHVA